MAGSEGHDLGAPGDFPIRTPPNPPAAGLILLLNAVLLCVGYFLIGQWRKGASVLAGFIILTVGTLFLGAPLVPVVLVLTAADGYLQTRHLHAGHRIGHWTFMKNHL